MDLLVQAVCNLPDFLEVLLGVEEAARTSELCSVCSITCRQLC